MAYDGESGLTPAFLEELKFKVNIVNLISSSVALTRKGNKWWACCPFHHEVTPSFCVDEARGFFYCFGCHEGGDVISWVMKTDDLSYIDAVKALAASVGMKVPETKFDREKAEKNERLYEMMRLAARHYYNNFTKNPKAQEYMQSRGLRPETLRKFGIGYSVGGQALINELRAADYTLKEMSECSLIGTNMERGDHYDFLANRIIVPIFDAQGRVIAFGGRVLEKKEGVAKYKNSQETVLFHKGSTLYGLNFVKKLRLKKAVDSLIIVEGYMDVIALVEAGFENAVASMGTALTEQQANLMRRMVGKVYISYDGDAAGQNNTMRGLDILKRAGLEVRVVNLPDGLDPDELIRQRGKAAYQKCLDEALPLYEHKIARAGLRFDLTSADGRGAYAKECLRIISDLDAVEQDAYLDLISEKTAVSKDALKKSVTSTAKPKPTVETPTKKDKKVELSPEKAGYYKACRFLLLLMLLRPDYTEEWVAPAYYEAAAHKAIAEYVLDCMVNKAPIMPSNIYQIGVDEEECNAVLTMAMPPDDELPKAFADSKRRVMREYYDVQKKDLLAAYGAAEDEDERKELLQQINAVQKQINNLSKR
ncbi:MAG: DNA primase [Clostridia bacterium]|nr:DNA primase [Clostridia bacterium]